MPRYQSSERSERECFFLPKVGLTNEERNEQGMSNNINYVFFIDFLYFTGYFLFLIVLYI